ncbi:MAG: hypothetical protein MJ066_04350 [Clostridia bacterium]|nr:hypothetical protein [Clostridia bacterium]
MKKRTSIINYLLLVVITAGLFFLVVVLANKRYSSTNVGLIILFFILGAIVSGFITTLMHEIGHLTFGKKNGFVCLSISVWFFKWYKNNGKLNFDFVKLGDSDGSSELISKSTDNMEKRLKNTTFGGLLFAFFPILISLVAFLVVKMPYFAYCIIAMFLPIGVYCFLQNALPMENEGVRNDGGIIVGLNKNDDESKVMISLLKIQSELYNGKTPSEIDEKYYFDLPQISEDRLNFILLLDARYSYYLDKGDYENAKKVSERLLSLEDYIPQGLMQIIKTDALFNVSTFDFDENKADDLMYEVDKYINGNVNSQTLRTKLAYVLNVKGETDMVDIFYKKGIKEANKNKIKGLGQYETKLLNLVKSGKIKN